MMSPIATERTRQRRSVAPADVERLRRAPAGLFAACSPFVARALSGANLRIAHGAKWLLIANLATQAGSLASFTVIARLLGKETYGYFAAVQSTVAATTGLAGLGLGVTATKYISGLKHKDPARAGRILAMSSAIAALAAILAGLLLIALAPAIAQEFFHRRELAVDLRLSSIYLVFLILNGYQLGALSGCESFKHVAKLTSALACCSVAITYLFTRRAGLGGGILGMGLNTFLLWTLYAAALRGELRAYSIRLAYKHAWKEFRALFEFSLPAALSGMVAASAIWLTTTMLARQVHGFSELALFSVANNLKTITLFAPAVVNRVSSPVLNDLLSGGDLAAYRKTFIANIAITGAFALLTALVLVALSPQLLRLFGRDFRDTHGVVPILLTGAVIEAAAGGLYQSIFVSRTLWYQVAVIGVWAAALTGMASGLAGRGAVGLAATYVAAWVCSIMLYGIFTIRHFRKLAAARLQPRGVA